MKEAKDVSPRTSIDPEVIDGEKFSKKYLNHIKSESAQNAIKKAYGRFLRTATSWVDAPKMVSEDRLLGIPEDQADNYLTEGMGRVVEVTHRNGCRYKVEIYVKNGARITKILEKVP